MWFRPTTTSQLSSTSKKEPRGFSPNIVQAPSISTAFTKAKEENFLKVTIQSIIPPPSPPPLFEFTTATFASNISGRVGPNLVQAQNSLSGPESNVWKINSNFYNVIAGIQYFKVPETSTYRINVLGAQGGSSTNWGRPGGLGAQMQGDFELTRNTTLKIIVGQQGVNNYHDGGGGGGTFVCLLDNSPLIIAGGGGGGSASGFSGSGGSWGTTSSSGNSTSWGSGGTAGNGGQGSTAGGGGGLTGDGSGSWRGVSFTNGALGGNAQADGGFGGGGGGGGTNGAGGGGGYSGGGYAPWSYDGAGGGSINNGINQSNNSNSNSGNGLVVITKLNIT